MSFLLLLVALAAGVANPFQSGLNADLNKQLGKPLWATLSVYATGLAALLLIQLCFRQAFPAGRIGSVPWWAWLGGAVSIVSTIIGLTIAQKLGSTLFTGASLSASVVTSVLLDQFGLVGFKQHTASPGRLFGCVLLCGGVWLVARF